MFLSFIVPVYNVQNYIERCLSSLIHQDINTDDYEVIIVNDGSTDDSLHIIDTVIEHCPNLNYKLINQENRGLSAARNIGLECAQGDFVWFVDSDDYIENNILLEIKEFMSNYPLLDVLAFNTDTVNDFGPLSIVRRKLKHNTYLSSRYVFLEDYKYPYSGAQFYIYNSRVLKSNHVTFKEGIVHEDLLFTSSIQARRLNYVFYDKVLYHYYLRLGSITNSTVTDKKCLDLLSIADELYHMTNDETFSSRVLYDQISRILGTLYRYNLSRMTRESRNRIRKLICSRNYWFKSIIYSRNWKYVIYLIIKYLPL